MDSLTGCCKAYLTGIQLSFIINTFPVTSTHSLSHKYITKIEENNLTLVISLGAIICKGDNQEPILWLSQLQSGTPGMCGPSTLKVVGLGC